jgi:ABC-type transport system involved in cytochrome bd biosynthesis fused ATPase/permease subunit
VGLGGAADAIAVMSAIGAGSLAERLGDAQLGVGGRALSGGEQKQVAIARALATSQPVLLLDEPTSGLDDHAQALVLSAIEKLRGQRTVLVVTHRPEPLAIADQVLLLGGSSSIVSRGPAATVTSRAAITSPSST